MQANKSKEVEIKILPDSPEYGSWKKGANGRSIEKGKWARRKDYREVGMVLIVNIDKILGFEDLEDSISATKDLLGTLPKHITKPIFHKLDKQEDKQQLTDYLYSMLLKYNQ